MIEKTIKLYSFNELSAEIQQDLIEDYIEGITEFIWVDEIIKSRDAIADLLNINFAEFYSYDGITYEYTGYNYNLDFDPEEMQAGRAIKFIYNNYITRCYTKYKNKMILDPCNITGYCEDYAGYNAFLEFCDLCKKNKNLTLHDFFEMLGEKFAEAINREIEYQTSEDYAKSEIIEQNYLYFADGRKYHKSMEE